MPEYLKKFHYYANCIASGDGQAIQDMRSDSRMITYQTMRRHCADLDSWADQLGYARHPQQGLMLASDVCVGYFRSIFRNQLCYYLNHSGIEHIWLEGQPEKSLEYSFPKNPKSTRERVLDAYDDPWKGDAAALEMAQNIVRVSRLGMIQNVTQSNLETYLKYTLYLDQNLRFYEIRQENDRYRKDLADNSWNPGYQVSKEVSMSRYKARIFQAIADCWTDRWPILVSTIRKPSTANGNYLQDHGSVKVEGITYSYQITYHDEDGAEVDPYEHEATRIFTVKREDE